MPKTSQLLRLSSKSLRYCKIKCLFVLGAIAPSGSGTPHEVSRSHPTTRHSR